MPVVEADYLLDTTAINKRLADRTNIPTRMRSGSFMVSREGSERVKELEKKLAGDKFVQAFEKMGWTLRSKLQFYPGEPYAYDLSKGAVLLDKEEWRVRAVFAIDAKPLPRIELPPTSVRQDKEQVASLVEVVKGEGMKPHNPRVRGEHTTVAPIQRRMKRRKDE